MSVFNTYDPAQPFPQPAAFGRGVARADGTHAPPQGFASHEVTSLLVHGVDEEFYETTAPDVLTAKTQTEVDTIKAQRQAERDARRQEINDRRDFARNNVGQGNSVPALRDRVDNLIEVLQDRGII